MQFLPRLLTCVAFCGAAAAQNGPEPGIHETVAAYLEQSAFEVALNAEGALEGPAAEWVRAAAAEAQFVFIGEEHDEVRSVRGLTEGSRGPCKQQDKEEMPSHGAIDAEECITCSERRGHRWRSMRPDQIGNSKVA